MFNFFKINTTAAAIIGIEVQTLGQISICFHFFNINIFMARLLQFLRLFQ